MSRKRISPPTGRREARSIATAPPSDQPAAMIVLGSTLHVETKIVVSSLGGGLTALFGRAAAAHAIANVFGNQHVQAQPAELVEVVLGIAQTHRVAVEEDHGRASERRRDRAGRRS